MFKKIAGTFITRIICSLLTFIIIIINSNIFGAEGTGAIGLFVLNITILQMLSSFVGGPSLVYMLPRHNNFQLILLSYIFSILTNFVGTIVLYLTNLTSFEFVWHLFAISIFFTFYYINSLVLLSKENIKAYNFLALIQIFIHFATLLFLLFVLNIKDVSAYIYAYGISYFISFIISLFWTVGKIRFGDSENLFFLFKKMFKYGVIIQSANLAQLLNYRLSYYVIEFLSGRKPLGLFDLGTKLSEAIWIFPKSISIVQYARISNCEDNKLYAKKITLAFLKITTVFAVFATLILVCIPANWLGCIFGNEFINSKRVIYALGFGIIMLSCNLIFSNYFSGLGKYKINTIGSVIGLIVTGLLFLLLMLFSQYFSGMSIIFIAGIISSCSYTASFIYSFACFKKDTNLKFNELTINKQDISILKEILRKLRK